MNRFALLAALLCSATVSATERRVDVLVAGGSASGTAAGIQAARMGAATLIAEPTPWLGGMLTAAGVSAIDGNYRLRSGFFGEFCRALEEHYGGPEALKTGWVSDILFEPHVGQAILRQKVEAEPLLDAVCGAEFRSAERCADGWEVAFRTPEGPLTVRCRVLIDATELGDVAKACGCTYDVGMDARADTGEEIAPERANGIIQDLTYVAVLKDYGPGADCTVAPPPGYDPTAFYGACASGHAATTDRGRILWPTDRMIAYGKLPNDKYMINWPIRGNDCYVDLIDADSAARAEGLTRARNFTLGFVHFIQAELGYRHLGLADDEFPTPDRLALIPYHRESRRIHGLVRLTVDHAARPYDTPQPLYRTGIAVGDYAVDHHHARYPGTDELPDLHFRPIPSYNVPLGVLIPRGVRGLIVAEKSISVSNLINGTTRLQPVVMQLGQAAGTLAALAVELGCEAADVPVRRVQSELLAAGGYLMPYLDLAPGDARFAAVQRIGATGLLRGEGRNEGWSNQTLFHPDRAVACAELEQGLRALYPRFRPRLRGDSLTCGAAFRLLRRLHRHTHAPAATRPAPIPGAPEVPIARGAFAQLLDRAVDPFGRVAVTHEGFFEPSAR